MGEKLDLEAPKTYNEKIQWLKLYDRKEAYTQQVDKYEVRAYISEKIGSDYLVPIHGVYDSVEEIDWSNLPEKFVLKATHGSRSNVICDNKEKLDVEKAKKNLNKWMKRNWYWYGRAYPYKNIKPRIICEEFLQDNITDYKFMCFNGEPKQIQVHRDRHNDLASKTLDFYDMNWNLTDISRPNEKSGPKTEKPKRFDEMVAIAKTLSAGDIHVRVDLYEVGGKIFFGEKTFYSSSGFAPFTEKKDDYLLGSWISLPIKK
ncbi:glycosyl transferase [Alkalibacterium sp. 20]|nr:glycosyl transferase [Alkalibacterium sp. 20]